MPTNLQFVPQNQFTFGTDGSIQITPQSLGIFDSLVPSNTGISSYTLTNEPLTNLQEYMQQSKNFFGIGDDSSGSNNNNATALGFNIPTLQLGLGALNALAGMYNSWNMNKLAKQQFNLQKDTIAISSVGCSIFLEKFFNLDNISRFYRIRGNVDSFAVYGEMAVAYQLSGFLSGSAHSQAEYGVHREVMTEDAPCAPVSEYGKAKLEFGKRAEELCRKSGMEYVHCRIFSVYGPGDHPWSLVNSCIRTFEEGGCMKLGECTQKWNLHY